MSRARRSLSLLLCWLVVYAFVTASLLGLRALPWTIPIALQTLLLSALLVPLISLVVAPASDRIAAILLSHLPKEKEAP